VSQTSPTDDLVGRDRLLDRLYGLVERVLDGRRVTALVAGEAGIGKTSLLREVAASAVERGARTAWGTCVDVDARPGYWPWTQALDGLVRAVGADRVRAAVGEDAALLASIVPSFASASPRAEASERDRLLAMDAAVRLLATVAIEQPLLLILDDLQWADESSLELFDFVARAPGLAGVGLIGAYRHDEAGSPALKRLRDAAAHGDHLQVDGLDVAAVRRLLERTTGQPIAPEVAEGVHRRTGGHPFFVRELALLGALDEPVPAAVRDTIGRRVDLLPAGTVAVLEVTAVIGLALLPDVVAAALETSVVDVETASRAAVDAGVLLRIDNGVRFAHDLLRETVLDRIEPARRVALNRAVGAALEARAARGGQVLPSAPAGHFLAAVSLDGPDRAVRWALRAAAADRAALAFGEAAGHLRRVRAAVADAAVDLDDRTLADVLLAEADALACGSNTDEARDLLRYASEVASRAGDAERIGRVALATAQLGATFAARRDEIVVGLERALAVVTDVDLEARLTATLARELQHSVAEDRPRAGPLSEQALAAGRRSGDPATLLTCLLARHDVLWTPGAGRARAEICREIVSVAVAAGDRNREAEGLLLLANAQLEQGSPAFEATLTSCLAILDDLGQPRHRYLAETRRACLALLRGRLDEAGRLIEQAAALGERIREPDTANVRMSQRLELVRARGDADEIRSFAAEAVAHWTGAPVHAHAVAAGFLAHVGDLDDAARHVATVVELGWREDRSYLWSVYVRELAYAAVALGDDGLCRELLDEIRPLGDSCGVNGAVVAFAGRHADIADRLAAALDRREQPARADTAAAMRRRGPVWDLTFAGRRATVPHAKGLTDIARLIAAAGTEIHALDLVSAGVRSSDTGEVADRSALEAYRRRLADLDADIADAELDNDPERRAAAEAERQSLIDELSRVTGAGRRPRRFANHPAERARKAVTGRVRDAIRKLEPLVPELAAHLERTIVTGVYCRYRSDSTVGDIEIETDRSSV
jgi:hypothetical protein